MQGDDFFVTSFLVCQAAVKRALKNIASVWVIRLIAKTDVWGEEVVDKSRKYLWGKKVGKSLAEGHRCCCCVKGYSIYIGTASTLYCRRAIIITIQYRCFFLEGGVSLNQSSTVVAGTLTLTQLSAFFSSTHVYFPAS